MSTCADHGRFDELAAGYALRSLEPAEEQEFAAHLVTCAHCRHNLTEHTDTLGHLAYAAEPFELPAGILAGIRAEIESSARADAVTSGRQGLPAAAATAAPASLDAARLRRRPKARRSWVGLAAAVALVLSLGVWNISLHRAKSQEDIQASRLVAAVATLEHGAKQRVELTNPLGHPVAIAVVRADNTVSLVVDGLTPNNPRNSTYVLWQKGAYGVVRAVGVFDVRSGVNVVPNLPLAADVVGVQELAVTEESGRHAPAASTKPLVADGVAA